MRPPDGSVRSSGSPAEGADGPSKAATAWKASGRRVRSKPTQTGHSPATARAASAASAYLHGLTIN